MAKDIANDVEAADLPDGELDGEGDLDELSDELLDEEALEEGDLDDNDLDDDDLDDDSLDEEEEEEQGTVEGAISTRSVEEEAPGDEEDEDELDDDDVEASLDVILKERLVVGDEDVDDEEVVDVDDRGDGSTRVLPKQPGEFVCRSCFLVKSETQLADKRKMLCRDCV